MTAEPHHRSPTANSTTENAENPPAALPDLTLNLERELTSLLAATLTPGPITELWVAFAACQRTIIQLTEILDAIAEQLASLPPGPAAQRESHDATHQRITEYAAKLRADGEQHQNIREALSRLGGTSAEPT